MAMKKRPIRNRGKTPAHLSLGCLSLVPEHEAEDRGPDVEAESDQGRDVLRPS